MGAPACTQQHYPWTFTDGITTSGDVTVNPPNIYGADGTTGVYSVDATDWVSSS